MKISIQEGLAGVEFGLKMRDHDMVTDALVLCRLTNMETGETSFFMTKTNQTDSIVCSGLITVAGDITAEGWEDVEDDE